MVTVEIWDYNTHMDKIKDTLTAAALAAFIVVGMLYYFDLVV